MEHREHGSGICGKDKLSGMFREVSSQRHHPTCTKSRRTKRSDRHHSPNLAVYALGHESSLCGFMAGRRRASERDGKASPGSVPLVQRRWLIGRSICARLMVAGVTSVHSSRTWRQTCKIAHRLVITIPSYAVASLQLSLTSTRHESRTRTGCAWGNYRP
jgi:hypothetical protein